MDQHTGASGSSGHQTPQRQQVPNLKHLCRSYPSNVQGYFRLCDSWTTSKKVWNTSVDHTLVICSGISDPVTCGQRVKSMKYICRSCPSNLQGYFRLCDSWTTSKKSMKYLCRSYPSNLQGYFRLCDSWTTSKKVWNTSVDHTLAICRGISDSVTRGQRVKKYEMHL